MALRDPSICRWPKHLRKELRVAMNDCKIVENKIYYRDRLLAPPDDQHSVRVRVLESALTKVKHYIETILCLPPRNGWADRKNECWP